MKYVACKWNVSRRTMKCKRNANHRKNLHESFMHRNVKCCSLLVGRQNDFDHLLAFQCTGNHYISGMNSHHDNRHEDRVWWYRCCEMQGMVYKASYEYKNSQTIKVYKRSTSFINSHVYFIVYR